MLPAATQILILTPVAAAVTCIVVTWLLLRSGAARIAIDQPNHRSLHTAATPRIGGLGIAAGFWAASAIAPAALPAGVWIGLVAVFLVSLLDDLAGLRVAIRFPVHLAAAALCAWGLLADAHGVLSISIATLVIAWMLNLYNFMDGANGLAGGMATIGFGAYAALAIAGGDHSFGALNLAVAAASAAFLAFNLPSGRVFMGDAGSIPLGFLAAALGIAGWQRGAWPVWFGAVVFAPFIVDASVTLARRALRGERVWQAHRSHYYQRLVRMGWSHARTARAEFALMAVSAAAACLAARTPGWIAVAILAALAVVYILLALRVDRAWARHAEGDA